MRQMVQQHLTYFWLRNEDIVRALSPGVAASGLVSECFTDPCYTTKLDPETITTRGILSSDREEEPHVTIVGGITIPVVLSSFVSPPVLLLTTQLEVVVALESNASIDQDGTTRIHGAAEPGILLLTIVQLKEQMGRCKLIRGMPVRKLWVEQRNGDGTWLPIPMRLTLPGDAVRLVELSDDRAPNYK
jgi:hypothetical protein